MLSPRETDKLVIYQVAELARKRRTRGVKLNFPESIALITEALLEAARDGKSVADVIELGRHVLTRAEVMDGDGADRRGAPSVDERLGEADRRVRGQLPVH